MEEVKEESKFGNDVEVNWCNIDMADNGYIVSWDEKIKKPEGSMDHCGYKSKKKLFSNEEEDQAWETFKHYKKLSMKKS